VAKLADRLERIARQTEAIAKEFVSIGDRVLSSISMTATIMVTALGYGAKRAPQEANIGGYATVNAAHSNALQLPVPKAGSRMETAVAVVIKVARKRPCCRALRCPVSNCCPSCGNGAMNVPSVRRVAGWAPFGAWRSGRASIRLIRLDLI
jgi:hypothetical protein